MLHLYRRHLKSCPHRSWKYTRCQCPIIVKGTLGTTEVPRQSLNTTDWDAAQRMIGEWIKAGQVGPQTEAQTIANAASAFLVDLAVRGLSLATIIKYRLLLERRLVRWAEEERSPYLKGLTLEMLTRFRTTWPDAPLAMARNQERLKSFFRWCTKRGWMTGDPAADLSPIRVRHDPTLPFTKEEVARILAACDEYPTNNAYGYDLRARVKAFVMVLLYTGLRIGDATTLAWERIKDGKVDLYTQKTGTHVYIPLPPVAVAALDALRSTNRYVFWTGRSTVKTAVTGWERSLSKLFRLAKVDGGHAHRFRDTFAVELLIRGVELADVSILLGHSSVQITEKHYAPWVSARQRRIETIVRQIWEPLPDPSSTEQPPADAPASPPTAVSASPDRTSSPPARAESADARTPRTRPTLRLIVSARSAAQ